MTFKHTLYLDFETFSRVDLRLVGGYEYARHETTEALILTYALDDDPVSCIDYTDSKNNEQRAPYMQFVEWLYDDTVELVAHNAQFDRLILAHVLGYDDTPLTRWRCTMCKALAHGFPAGLAAVGGALRVPTPKHKNGKTLINRFCSPAASNHKADRYDRHSHPEQWAQFKAYAIDDINAMRQVDKQLPSWNYQGRFLDEYHFDQRVNDRGFAVDRELVEAGARATIKAKKVNAARFVEIIRKYFGYEELDRPTKRGQLLKFLNAEFELGLEDTRSETFQTYLKNKNLPDDAREIMQLSILANKTSTAKYAALQPIIGSDDRARGTLQFSGAARTRRHAGRVFQPHNLPSRGLPKPESIDQYIDALKCDLHTELFPEDDQMLLASAALRGVVVSEPHQQMIVSDLSNIEGRLNTWLAGEEWKLEAFRAYDRGEGPDLYKVTAAELLDITPEEVDGEQRQKLGKVPELSLGYAGGVGAIQRFAPDEMSGYWPTIERVMSDEHIGQAHDNYKDWGRERAPEMDKLEWIASETVKLSWRAKHPKIAGRGAKFDEPTGLWKACEKAARNAMRKGNTEFKAGEHLTFKRVGYAGFQYLLVRLPSGGALCYFDPRLSSDGSLSYMGMQSKQGETGFGKWTRIYTYGGKLVENACQGLARDILMAGLTDAEAAGYRVVLHVHDEGVTEVSAQTSLSVEHLSGLLATERDYLPELPLAAAGFATTRYRK